MKFKTSSGIKSIIGRDLITDPYIAIFELVKNSYDARATEVIVSFNTNAFADNKQNVDTVGRNGKIFIVDNGRGMSKDDLENKWLFLAYSDKKEGYTELDDDLPDNSTYRKLKNRVYVGSKGIGRFSSDRLGSKIKIRTKVAKENIEHELVVNWDDFDNSLSKKFEDINVSYKSNKELTFDELESYTIIEISQLREVWTYEMLDVVMERLRRLKDPFSKHDDLFIYCGINIFSLIKGFKGDRNDLVNNNVNEFLKEKGINISAKISHKGTSISLIDRGNLIYELDRKGSESILNKVDGIEISVTYLTSSAKRYFTENMGIRPVEYGNIFIYRNGFRVFPYGEVTYDTFGLNIRKTQGYNRYLGTRELIGFISINDSQNYFKEASSRDNGFIENGYFKALENFYMGYLQRPLEKYAQLIKFGEDKETQEELNFENLNVSDDEKENFKQYITKNGFYIKVFNDEIDFEANKAEKIIERIQEAIENPNSFINSKKFIKDTKKLESHLKDIKQENIEVKKLVKKKEAQLEIIKRQNHNLSKNRDEKSYGKNINHHMSVLSNTLNNALKLLLPLKKNLDETNLSKLNLALDKIQSTMIEMQVFRDLLEGTDYDLTSDEYINWLELAEWYFINKGRNSYYSDYIVTCSFEGTDKTNWNVNSSHVQVMMMFENFYRNAYEHKASFIDFTFQDNCLIVSSDSTPIAGENLQAIFELGFSTKSNGTGIGLYQISTFLSDIGYQIVALNDKGIVKFIISKE